MSVIYLPIDIIYEYTTTWVNRTELKILRLSILFASTSVLKSI